MINEYIMKNTPLNTKFQNVEYATVGKKRFPEHFSIAKKNMIIRNIEIIVTFAIVLIAGAGIYGVFN
jgi:hypothetical protein